MRKVSVVIPARNDADALPAAIASVLAQDEAPESFELDEILVVIGPSRDGTESVADELAAANALVTAVPNPHGGIPQALNIGLRRANGDILVRVDAHSVLPEHYLRRAVSSLETTSAANVGAIQSPVGVEATQRAIAAAMRHKLGSGAAAYRGSTALERVDTAFLGAFRIEALRQVGGWDESFQRNEDAELNIRLHQEGFEVWLDPTLVVEYTPRSSLGALASQYWHYGWWRARTIRKHRRFSARQVIPPAAVVGLAASTVGAIAVSPWLAAMPLGYLMVMAGAASGTSELSWPERLTMFAALIVMHLSWGTAFIVSALDPRALGRAT